MSWKFVVVAVAVIAGLVFLIVITESWDAKEGIKWRDFVAQHHCSIVPTKWYEQTRWQCDGFQVQHQ